MNRRSAFAVLVGIALLMPTSARAQSNGNGNGGNNGNGNANGHDNDSNGGGNGNGNANGHDKGDDRGGNGNANGQGGNSVTPDSPATPGDEGELSESQVLAAVHSGSAVSLETLLPDVRTRTGGEIINAKLQQTRGFLLYGVTVLTPGGKVVTEYYYARSGIHVGN
jgi:hypothetical protein